MSNIEAAILLRRAAAALDQGVAATSSSQTTTATTTTTTCTQSTRPMNVLGIRPRNEFTPYNHNHSRRNWRNAVRETPPSCSTWTHRFFCLGKKMQDTVPLNDERSQLLRCGLGEKKISIVKDSDPMTLKKKLEEEFPQLKTCGGFDLCRTAIGSRVVLEKIPMPPAGYTTGYLCNSSSLHQALCYIVPIQKDLDMQPSSTKEECLVSELCFSCGESVPLDDLREHISLCKKSDSSDEEVPKTKKFKQTTVCQFVNVQDDPEEKDKEKKVSADTKKQCPVCLEYFDEAVLELHASSCGETKVCSTFQEWLELNKPQWEKNWNISVIRRLIVQNTMQQVKEAQEEDWSKKIVVEFVGEEGLDSGGLLREFFSVLFKKSPIFEKGLFSHDAQLLDKKHYFYMGKLVAMAVLSGHPGPRCIKDYIVEFIVKGTLPELSDTPAAEISRADVKHAVIEISLWGDNLMDKFGELLQECGFTKLLTSTTKNEAISAIKTHFLFNKGLPGLLQFMEGLKLHSVLQRLQSFPSEGKIFLVESEYPDVTDVKAFFKPSYSKDEVKKEKEELIVYNFHQFLNKLERGQVLTPWIDLDTDTNENTVLTIGDLLQALVGCPALPLDISSGIITFDHESKGLATINTCAPSINFTRIDENTDYNNFLSLMKAIIVGAYGFGQT